MAHAKTLSKQGNGETRIAGGTRVRGRIAGDGDLTIEGDVEGEISVRGGLTIAEGAAVTSENVEAQTVSISGKLEGNVTASGQVRVAAGSHVRGNLSGSSVAIDEGAEFSGRLDCDFELPAELSKPHTSHARER